MTVANYPRRSSPAAVDPAEPLTAGEPLAAAAGDAAPEDDEPEELELHALVSAIAPTNTVAQMSL